MAQLTDRSVRAVSAPQGRVKISWDDETKGLGLCVYPSGRRSFVLDYTAKGRQRRIGPYLFPGRDGKPMTDFKRTWRSLCRDAGLVEVAGHRRPKGDEGRAGLPAYRPAARPTADLRQPAGLERPQPAGHRRASRPHPGPDDAALRAPLRGPQRRATERLGALVANARNGDDAEPSRKKPA